MHCLSYMLLIPLMLQFISAVNNDQNFAMNCRFSWNFKEKNVTNWFFYLIVKKKNAFKGVACSIPLFFTLSFIFPWKDKFREDNM